MESSKNSWKSKPESLFQYRPSLKSNSSVSRLSEFHNRLISSRKSPSAISIPTWKVFRSQIHNNVSPPRVERPRFDHYSDINSFRSNSPRINSSPLWRSRIKSGSIHSNISGNSSPPPSRSNRVLQIIKIEDLRRAIEILSEIDEEELSTLPNRYLQEMQEFCKVIRERVKN